MVDAACSYQMPMQDDRLGRFENSLAMGYSCSRLCGGAIERQKQRDKSKRSRATLRLKLLLLIIQCICCTR